MRQETGRKLVAVRTLVFQDEQVLLVGHRSPKTGLEWWMAPGGVVTLGEQVVDAAAREVKEETGLEVEIDELVYWLEWVSDQSYCLELYFLGTVKAGTLTVGSDPELDEVEQLIFDVRFFTLAELRDVPIYPTAFRTLLPQHYKDGFPEGATYLGVDKPDLPR